jgi:excisionase family DNA binding protein
MVEDREKGGLLGSWKEIASYLGVDKRTCYRWEKKLGLPIHRFEGTQRSRVFAYKDELDRWRAERPGDRTRLQPGSPPRPGLQKSYFLVAAIIVILVILYLELRPGMNREPLDFRITGSALIILNDQGTELWRYNTGLENLLEEGSYRQHFQMKRKDANDTSLHPYLMIKDINRDGKKEVLFSTQTQDEFNEGLLFCFSDNGKILWRFGAGKVMKYGPQVYTSDYRIMGFEVSNLDDDGRNEIIIFSTQRHFFPCQLAVLEANGRLRGEYWNAGHISDISCADINGDRKKEILFGGQNNEHNKGCLVVFDPAEVGGGSPQKVDKYSCRELAPGTEKAYILFPRTDADIAEAVNEATDAIEILKDNRIMVRAHISRLLFDFDYGLNLQEVRSSHNFESLHRKFSQEGKIKSVLDDAYFKRLGQTLLYWDGRDWTTTPSLANPWKTRSQR